MSISIVPTTEAHLPGYHAVLDAVAKERKWIALLEAFPYEPTAHFARELQKEGGVHLVAVDGDQVVGWCDIGRHPLEGFRHAGRLGMGLLPLYRGRGIGKQLVTAALAAARDVGMERVELEVFSSNRAAVALYEHMGFEHEGVRRNARKLDGKSDDLVLMAVAL